MLCDICHTREAKIFYTEIINGEKHEQHLCEECASTTPSFGLKDKQGNELPIGTILSGILANYAKGVAANQSKEPVCMRCGMTASELVKSGKVGCPACYEAFYMILDKNLKTLQGGNEHHGKIPRNAKKFDVPEELRSKGATKEPNGKINVVFNPVKIMHTDVEDKDAQLKVTSSTEFSKEYSEPAEDAVFNDISEIRAIFKPLLDKAIAVEDYEEAARLRDKLHRFEERLKSDEGGSELKPAQPVKAGKTEKTAKNGMTGKTVKTGKAGKTAKAEGTENTGKTGKTAKAEETENTAKPEKTEKTVKNGESERAAKAARSEKALKRSETAKEAKTAKTTRTAKAAKATKATKTTKTAKPIKSSGTDKEGTGHDE